MAYNPYKRVLVDELSAPLPIYTDTEVAVVSASRSIDMDAQEIVYMLQNKSREHLEQAYILEELARHRQAAGLPIEGTYRRARHNRAKAKALAHAADEIQHEMQVDERSD